MLAGGFFVALAKLSMCVKESGHAEPVYSTAEI
jgi:hypothetical protein